MFLVVFYTFIVASRPFALNACSASWVFRKLQYYIVFATVLCDVLMVTWLYSRGMRYICRPSTYAGLLIQSQNYTTAAHRSIVTIRRRTKDHQHSWAVGLHTKASKASGILRFCARRLYCRVGTFALESCVPRRINIFDRIVPGRLPGL